MNLEDSNSLKGLRRGDIVTIRQVFKPISARHAFWLQLNAP